MLLLDPDAEYADVLERVLYNGFLSGIRLSGDRFFYQNRLAGRREYRRVAWYDCACCPSNVVRLLPRIGELCYALGKNSIHVNLYAAGTASLDVGGTRVVMRQATRYPWDGKVTLRVEPEKEAEFSILLRIPDWCRGSETPGGLYRWESGARPTLTVRGEARNPGQKREINCIARWDIGNRNQ